MSFSAGIFALAGVAAAAGPILVHLMNRRRFRTIDWAAMQFLREAVRQSRRVLHLRDLLLLLLRTVCVLLFGLAMARPYFSSTTGAFGAGEPIHAVLLVDNSLSMGYRSLQGTLLDEVRAVSRRFIEELPAGSRVAVIPVCSDPRHYSLDPAATKQDALETLDEVTIVDRAAGFDASLELGKAALKRLPDMPNKRLVFVGDGQRANFPAAGLAERFGAGVDAPSDVQLVSLPPEAPENAWIAELRAVDGAAVPGADAEFLAVLRYEGAVRRADVQVNFHVDGKLVQSRVVDLEPNQRREVSFLHRFESAEISNGPRYSTASVELSDDRLPEDNRRDTVVPIVAGLGVLYVSEHGPNEATTEALAGRGLWLQRLLAPVVDRADVQPKLVQITHIAVSTLEPRLLQDARLVVLAGVRSPGDHVPLLREYVEQGGQLLITAGGDFDPAAWHDAAWLDGAGLLPAPPAAKTVNVRDASPPKPMRLDLRTLGHAYFQIEDVPSDELNELYAQPLFFEAVAAEPTPEAVQKMLAVETARIVTRRSRPTTPPAATATPTAAAPTASAAAQPLAPLLRLSWPEPAADRDHELDAERLAARTAPTVIGRFDNGLPLLIERRLDRGTVVFCTTGLQSPWNTLAMSRAVVVLDRLTRTLLERTLPRRNFDTTEPVLVPLRPQPGGTYLQLVGPDDRHEPVVVDALGDDKYALVLRDLAERGTYRIVARQADSAAGDAVAETKLWEIPLAVAGPAAESQLAVLERDQALAGVDATRLRWLSRGEEIGVAGATVRGQYLWKWLMASVLACLLVELALIGWMRPAAARNPAPVGERGRMSWLAKLLGYRSDETIRDLQLSSAAPWAETAPGALWVGCLLLAVGAVWFYVKHQTLKNRKLGYLLAGVRALLLCLILLFLAEPTLNLRVTTHPKPWLWLLVDGSASMAIEDAAPDVGRAESLGDPQAAAAQKTRLAQVRDVFERTGDENLFRKLSEKFQLRAFTFDRPGEVRPLDETGTGAREQFDPQAVAKQLTAEGQVTALGDALDDLRRRYGAQRPAGVVIFSDFNKNAGLSPTETGARLGVPLYCVGVGPASAFDVAVDLTAPLLMKKGEQSEVHVGVRRQGDLSRAVTVRLSSHKIGASQAPKTIGEQILAPGVDVAEFPFSYAPDETGRFEFTAEVDPQPLETIVENNTARREVNVRDDFLHLTFVDYEPNWEWRFIKEVFHRDRLVGMRGFRTFLRSADPKVRQTNELFLSSLTPPRGEFFVNDVLFLGDMPATSLSTRYCEMVKEFVDKFGGGLVILSGPHFGPGELASTPLADLLPVRVIPGGKFADTGEQPFMPRLTDAAAEFDFMQLGANQAENRNLWSRLGPLEWFQPTAGVHDQARVLLEHPTAKCADGRTPQPLLAVRRYGKGEVVYLAMNETWRLRREYGETYYRKFWGQMIHRLGLSHALGNQKRFVVKTDRRQYQSGERVTASVAAYDQNYEPLNPAKLQPPLTQLAGELLLPGTATDPNTGARMPLKLAPLREGEFQTEFEVQEPGEYVVRVQDPLSTEQAEVSFRVANVSAERRSAVRDTALQQQLADLRSSRFGMTGRPVELSDVDRLAAEIYLPDEVESYPERIPLWNTWAAFLLVVILMLCEWFVRKWVHLP